MSVILKSPRPIVIGYLSAIFMNEFVRFGLVIHADQSIFLKSLKSVFKTSKILGLLRSDIDTDTSKPAI